MNIEHTSELPSECVEQVITHLTAAKTILEEYCPTLTVDQRRGLPKMGDDMYAFGADSLAHAENRPEFLPAYINPGAWNIDMGNVHQAKRILVLIDDVSRLVTDLRMAAGSKAYHCGRALYHSVQRAAADGIPGAQSICDDLKTYFTPRSRGTRAAAPVQPEK